MVQQEDTKQVGTLSESAGEQAILWARRDIAGRVIVRTDPGGSVHQDQRFEHFAGMHDGQGQGADRHDIDPDDAVLGIEPADQELLAVQVRKQGPEDSGGGDRGQKR